MIPQPQGFTLIVEPVNRERIEELSNKYAEAKDSSSGFGVKTVDTTGYEQSCLMRVVAAGPGMQYEHAFIKNHIHVGDQVLGTVTEMTVAKDFADPKEHWEFDGKKYMVTSSRGYNDISGSTIFVVQGAKCNCDLCEEERRQDGEF